MTGSSTNNRMARNGIDWGSVAIFFSLMKSPGFSRL